MELVALGLSKESLLTTSVGPVASASGGKEKSRVGFLEEVSVLAKSFFFFLGHTVRLSGIGLRSVKGVVVTLEFTSESQKTLDDDALELTSLFEGGAWGKTGSTDGSASTASGGQNVFSSGVNGGLGKVIGVHVSGVLGVGAESVVTVGNDGVKKLSEKLVGFFVTSNESDSFDHRVARVVNSSFDAVSEVDSELGGLVL